MPDALRLAGLRAGYGETVILEDVALALPERGSLAVLGRNGVGKTTLLLMDEPLEGLAPIIVEALLKSLQRLMAEDELAVILVEQHAKLALQVTEQALVMSRGRIIHHGTSRELLADPERLGRLVVA